MSRPSHYFTCHRLNIFEHVFDNVARLMDKVVIPLGGEKKFLRIPFLAGEAFSRRQT